MKVHDPTDAGSEEVSCRTQTHVFRFYDGDEPYDLVDGSQEVVNRIDVPAYASIVAEIKNRMLRRLIETGDVIPSLPDRRN